MYYLRYNDKKIILTASWPLQSETKPQRGCDWSGDIYSETQLLRNLKGNEKSHVLIKVRFIQNKERAKKLDWRCPWSTEKT